jgi:hypothetical protein
MVYNTERRKKVSMEKPPQITQHVTAADNHRDFHSDYICPECGGLLYAEVDDGHDICVNPDCKRFPDGLQFSDPSREGSPRLHGELETAHAELVNNIRQCAPAQLVLYIYVKRKALISFALRSGVIPSMLDFLALGELLITLNANPPRGNINNQQFFESILQQMKKRTEYLNFIDDMENKRLFVWPSGHDGAKIFMMKYLGVIRNMQGGDGIASSSFPQEASTLFEFKDIQESVSRVLPPTPGIDYVDFLDSLWPYALTLKHSFSINPRTVKQYDYKPGAVDIIAMMGLYFSLTDNDTVIIPISQLQQYFNKYAEGTKPFSKFLNRFIGSASRVPIMARSNDCVITDRLTLLYFIIYLHGEYRASDDGGETNERIARKKQESSEALEQNLRRKISQHGYRGPKETIREQFDYDVMRLSESRKRIVLADLTFRDFSPLSGSGHPFLQQGLIDQSQALLAEAGLQMEKLEYFKHEPEKFRKYLNPQAGWREYEVRAYLLTKHTPLIDRHGDVRIMSVSDFLGSEL